MKKDEKGSVIFFNYTVIAPAKKCVCTVKLALGLLVWVTNIEVPAHADQIMEEYIYCIQYNIINTSAIA